MFAVICFNSSLVLLCVWNLMALLVMKFLFRLMNLTKLKLSFYNFFYDGLGLLVML